MIDPDALNVWLGDRLAGYLWRNSVGAMGFRYDTDWLGNNGFALSLTLPLTTAEFAPEDSVAHRFFANLLPEGGVRERIVRDLKIANSDFELLRAIGGECAGALTILPVERSPSDDQRYRPLTSEALSQLIARRGQVYASWPKPQRPRLSLAGAQDKCPVLIRDGHYFLPEAEAPTTHILKFELPDYRHLPAFETFTSLLARQIGLPVVDIELRSIEKHRYAQIARFDRIWQADSKSGVKVKRLHQEDFCQALGYGYEKKYQDSGGPDFASCYRMLLDISTDPANDALNLLRWQIFNVLVGNSDGHAKNLSLLYQADGGIRLSPFYDLVCTRAIERIDHHLAFDVGGQRNPRQISRKNWIKMADACDVNARFLLKLVEETAALLLEQAGNVRRLFEERYGDYPSLQRIERIVTQQCRRVS